MLKFCLQGLRRRRLDAPPLCSHSCKKFVDVKDSP